MKTIIHTLIIAIIIVHIAIFATLWSAKKEETKVGIQTIGYKAVLNDKILIDSIIQDTTEMKFIVVTKKI